MHSSEQAVLYGQLFCGQPSVGSVPPGLCEILELLLEMPVREELKSENAVRAIAKTK